MVWPKPHAVDSRPGLAGRVKELLKLGWSPALIAGRLRREAPDEQTVRVSHEAI